MCFVLPPYLFSAATLSANYFLQILFKSVGIETFYDETCRVPVFALGHTVEQDVLTTQKCDLDDWYAQSRSFTAAAQSITTVFMRSPYRPTHSSSCWKAMEDRKSSTRPTSGARLGSSWTPADARAYARPTHILRWRHVYACCDPGHRRRNETWRMTTVTPCWG